MQVWKNTLMCYRKKLGCSLLDCFFYKILIQILQFYNLILNSIFSKATGKISLPLHSRPIWLNVENILCCSFLSCLLFFNFSLHCFDVWWGIYCIVAGAAVWPHSVQNILGSGLSLFAFCSRSRKCSQLITKVFCYMWSSWVFLVINA